MHVTGLLTQAVGFKYVRLYAASNTPLLYRSTAPWESQRRWPTAETEAHAPAGAAPQGTISLVDVEAPDLQRFPLFEQARFVETVLVRLGGVRGSSACMQAAHSRRVRAQGPGDALFIPAGVWHFVKSLSTSASISFVF
jgi:lysine-specific demethylase 8